MRQSELSRASIFIVVSGYWHSYTWCIYNQLHFKEFNHHFFSCMSLFSLSAQNFAHRFVYNRSYQCFKSCKTVPSKYKTRPSCSCTASWHWLIRTCERVNNFLDSHYNSSTCTQDILESSVGCWRSGSQIWQNKFKYEIRATKPVTMSLGLSVCFKPTKIS